MLQEPRQVLELLHRRDQLLEILELARRLRLLARLPHVGIAGFVEHGLGEVGVRYVLGAPSPAVEVLNDAGQTAARGGLQLVGLDELQRRGVKRAALGAGKTDRKSTRLNSSH